MTATIAVDLDRTLVYSLAAAGPLEGLHTAWVEDYDGAPLSLMTVGAYERLAELSLRHDVVPVTTRTPEQYARLRLPGRLPVVVCANGGVLLRAGARDPEWDRRVRADLAAAAPVGDVEAEVGRVAGEPWVRSLRRVESLFVYVVAERRAGIPAGWLDDLAAWAAPLGWEVSLQGRKVYVVPRALSKGAAAQGIARESPGPLLAAGDSLLDRSLLDAAVVGVRPAHGELHEQGYLRPGLRVTAHAGVRAGEEVLELLECEAERLVGALPVRQAVACPGSQGLPR